MAIGDIYIRRNSLDESVLPDAGGELFAEWDTIGTQQGTVVSGYAAGTFTLPAGMYLIMYSEKFSTNDTTNNERLEVQSEINVSTGQVSAYSQDFIRKASGQQDCSVNSAMILEASSTVSFKTRFYRTDTSTSGFCTRAPEFGSVMIVQLDPTNAYGMYSASSSQTFTNTEARTNFDTTLRQDSGFTRDGDTQTTIQVADAGRYFITYSMFVSQTATGREDVTGRLTNNGVEVVGTNSFSYSRGADGCQDSAISWQGIVELPAGSLLRLNVRIPTTATFTSSAGSPSISLWKLPTASKTAILETTSGDYNASGNFTFDTIKQIDASFSTDLQKITVPGGDYFLVFSTFHQDAADAPQRAYPQVRVRTDGVLSKTSSAGVYHRAGGSGAGCSVTINDISTVFGESIEIFTEPTGVEGSLTCDSGQFSVLSLSSLFGVYTFPAGISSISDGTVADNQTGLIISGRSFGAAQGSGNVYLSASSTFDVNAVAQSVDSWSETSITFDSITDSFSSGILYLFVVTDGGETTIPIIVSFGILSYDLILDNSLPDHRWTLDNTYDDTGNRAGSNMTVSVTGTQSFENVLLSEGTIACARMQNGKREAANSSFINLPTATYRLMGGWIRLGSIAESLTCIYEEGGSINNLAFFVGVGNVLVAQLADSGDDNVQMFSDFSLVVGRTYHIMFTFDYNAVGDKEFLLYIDGVKQSVSAGNPLLATDLDAHSGDIAFGSGGGNLEVGGTDVLFAPSPDWYLSNWVTYINRPASGTPAELISVLFERGAVPTYTITQDTQANMQAQLDVFANTSMPNTPLTFRIEKQTGGGDLTLDANAIIFDDAASIHLESRSGAALNWINSNGSNLTIEKCLLTAGPINILNPVVLTLNTLKVNTEVRVFNSSTGVEVGGVENSTTSESFDLLGISSVDIVLVSIDYKYLKLSNVDTTSNVSLPIQQQFDRNYTNP
jgi:hypothetical protein